MPTNWSRTPWRPPAAPWSAWSGGGKPIVPRSVAHYTLQRLKSGRRSTGSGRTDVMSPGCQLDGRAFVSSLDQPFAVAEGGDDGMTLGDAIACRRDDPSQRAARNIDWDGFLDTLDGPQRYIVLATAEGQAVNRQAAELGVSAPSVCQRRGTIAKRARDFWGDGVLADAQAEPLWRRQMPCCRQDLH